MRTYKMSSVNCPLISSSKGFKALFHVVSANALKSVNVFDIQKRVPWMFLLKDGKHALLPFT